MNRSKDYIKENFQIIKSEVIKRFGNVMCSFDAENGVYYLIDPISQTQLITDTLALPKATTVFDAWYNIYTLIKYNSMVTKSFNALSDDRIINQYKTED